MQNIKINKTHLDQDNFRRVISVGIDYHIVITADHWKQINALEIQESVEFKDEQSEKWDVDFDGKNLTFFNIKDKNFVSISKEKLA